VNKTIKAIYERGVLRPLKKIALPEHKKVTLAILESDDLPVDLICKAADKSKSFRFLKNTKENFYSLKDGKRI
jgi:predicted DNA-binding antitoxin AbrB/MazE fold protein